MKGHAILLVVALISWHSAARADSPALAPADREFFEKRVRPILVERCYSCHSATGKTRGGLRLDSQAALLAGGDTGPVVVAGQLDKSSLLAAVRYTNPDLQMPPAGKIPAREIAILEEWVRRGAPYPGADSASSSKKGIDIAEGRKFWSFQPLKTQQLPALATGRDWPQRRIDSFILAGLEKNGFTPSPRAARSTLLRRVTFDLIGLPPTPEEIEAFLHDDRPDAYVRGVDRLLASPRHGERWARFWLDLVRYCDVPESWADVKGAPHLYRDWVVRALNDDLPYDQFIQRQLAADLLPGTTPEDRAALGFLGLSPNYWKELKLDHNVIKGVVAEEWEERIHTLTSTVLGLTVACARCHDHKFEPITTQDYYALAGVFASIRQVDRSILPDDQAAKVQQARKRLGELEAQLAKLKKDKKRPADADELIRSLQKQIDTLKATPRLNDSLVPGIDDSSLVVLPDGEHRTKLLYKAGVAQDVAIQLRGNPSKTGSVVPRRFLAVLSPGEPRLFKEGSGRLDLARALTEEGGALAARVIVNRVWRHHFGEGLVSTPSDFGTQGARPSHPELLDDLAARFVANGWSLKWLHREIVLSAAYQQASATRDRREAQIDPDNRWLWRMNRRRLEIEAWRDAMLASAGNLDARMGGPAQELSEPNHTRRTLYGLVRRRDLNDILRLHDFPDPVTHSPARLPSTTPLQQLFVLNSPLIGQQAKTLARRLSSEVPTSQEARLQRAYQLLFGRNPTQSELALGTTFLAEEGNGDAAWERYARALLASNEFLFID